MNYTLSAVDVFPNGTSVGAYLARDQTGAARPMGTPVSTQTMTNGSLTFTGLTEDTSYTAWGQVGGAWRRVDFKVDAIPHDPIHTDDDPTVYGDWTFEANGSVSFDGPADFDGAVDLSGATVVPSANLAALNEAETVTGNWTFTPAGGVGSVTASELAILRAAFFNVKFFGALGDGITDDRAAIQAAIDACHAVGGGIVYLPTGTYLLNSTGTGGRALELPRDSTGLVIRGAGPGTVIKLTTNCVRAFDLWRTADDQTWQNLAIEDLTVDGNNVQLTYSSHGILGNLVNGGWSQRANFENIRVSRVKAVNFHTKTGIGDATRQLVSLVPTQSATGQAENTVRDVLIEDCDFSGGNSGVVVAGYPTGAAGARNVFLDDIRIERCEHDTGVTPTAGYTASNFHVGSYGHGRRVSIRDCIGKRSGDVGIEVNGMNQATVSNCYIEDAAQAAFFCRNFRTPYEPESQVVTWDNCHALYKALDPTPTMPCRGFWISADGATGESPLAVTIRNGSVHTDTDMDAGIANGRAIYSNNTALRRLTVDGFKFTAPNAALAPGSANSPALVYVRPATEARVSVRNALLRMNGTVNSNVTLTALNFVGDVNLDLDAIDFDFQLTGLGAGKMVMASIGSTAAATLRGSARRLRVVNDGDDTTPYALLFGASITFDGLFVVDGCDFSDMAAGVVGSGFHYTTAADRSSVVIRNHKGNHSGVIASAATITIPEGMEYAEVSGTTSITSITRSFKGHRLTLKFQGALTLTDGSNLVLAGNFVTTADDSVTLVSDGTNWVEAGRSVN